MSQKLYTLSQFPARVSFPPPLYRGVRRALFHGHAVTRGGYDLLDIKERFVAGRPLQILRAGINVPSISMPFKHLVVNARIARELESRAIATLNPVETVRWLAVDTKWNEAELVRRFPRIDPIKFDGDPAKYLGKMPQLDDSDAPRDPFFEIIAPKRDRIAAASDENERFELACDPDPLKGITSALAEEHPLIYYMWGALINESLFNQIGYEIDRECFEVTGPHEIP